MSVEELRLLGDVDLTPVLYKLLEKMSDGEQHKPDDLAAFISDIPDKNLLQTYISKLRGMIYESGYLIAGHLQGRTIRAYQLTRRLRVRID